MFCHYFGTSQTKISSKQADFLTFCPHASMRLLIINQTNLLINNILSNHDVFVFLFCSVFIIRQSYKNNVCLHASLRQGLQRVARKLKNFTKLSGKERPTEAPFAELVLYLNRTIIYFNKHQPIDLKRFTKKDSNTKRYSYFFSKLFNLNILALLFVHNHPI